MEISNRNQYVLHGAIGFSAALLGNRAIAWLSPRGAAVSSVAGLVAGAVFLGLAKPQQIEPDAAHLFAYLSSDDSKGRALQRNCSRAVCWGGMVALLSCTVWDMLQRGKWIYTLGMDRRSKMAEVLQKHGLNPAQKHKALAPEVWKDIEKVFPQRERLAIMGEILFELFEATGLLFGAIGPIAIADTNP